VATALRDRAACRGKGDAAGINATLGVRGDAVLTLPRGRNHALRRHASHEHAQEWANPWAGAGTTVHAPGPRRNRPCNSLRQAGTPTTNQSERVLRIFRKGPGRQSKDERAAPQAAGGERDNDATLTPPWPGLLRRWTLRSAADTRRVHRRARRVLNVTMTTFGFHIAKYTRRTLGAHPLTNPPQRHWRDTQHVIGAASPRQRQRGQESIMAMSSAAPTTMPLRH
jgi:hypothetical protein